MLSRAPYTDEGYPRTPRLDQGRLGPLYTPAAWLWDELLSGVLGTFG